MPKAKKTVEIPKGIRQRGNGYQWNVQINGKRLFGTAETLEEAITAKTEASKEPLRIEQQQTLTLGKMIDEVLNLYEVSAKTQSYKSALSSYKFWLKFFDKDMLLINITTHDIDEIIQQLIHQKLKPATINLRLTFLSKLFTTAQGYEWIDKRPKFHFLKLRNGRVRFFSDEEEKAILSYLKQPYSDMVAILLDTGMRCGELLNLRQENIDLSKKLIDIWETKTDHPRIIPMTNRVVQILSQYQSKDKLFNIKGYQLEHEWDSMRKALGYESDTDFVIHACRHTCASRLIQRGISIPIIQRWLGHNNIATTMRYAHLRGDELYQAVKVLNR